MRSGSGALSTRGTNLESIDMRRQSSRVFVCFFIKWGKKVEKNSTAELFISFIILILRLAFFGEASNLVA